MEKISKLNLFFVVVLVAVLSVASVGCDKSNPTEPGPTPTPVLLSKVLDDTVELSAGIAPSCTYTEYFNPNQVGKLVNINADKVTGSDPMNMTLAVYNGSALQAATSSAYSLVTSKSLSFTPTSTGSHFVYVCDKTDPLSVGGSIRITASQ